MRIFIRTLLLLAISVLCLKNKIEPMKTMRNQSFKFREITKEHCPTELLKVVLELTTNPLIDLSQQALERVDQLIREQRYFIEKRETLNGNTALTLAASNPSLLPIVQKLIAAGANLMHRDKKGNSALGSACWNEQSYEHKDLNNDAYVQAFRMKQFLITAISAMHARVQERIARPVTREELEQEEGYLNTLLRKMNTFLTSTESDDEDDDD